MTYTPRRPPLGHQQEILQKSWSEEAWGLLMEFGTGKSYTLVTTAGMLYWGGLINTVVVVAPKGMYQDWGVGDPETSHWLQNMDPAVMENTMVHLWQGGHSVRERRALELLEGWHGLRVLVVNTEALSASKNAEAVIRRVCAGRSVLMAVDESSMIRNASSKRTKTIIKLGALAQYRRILTGLPTPRSTLDLYTQFYFLDWKILGHKSFYTYRARYAVLRPMTAGGRTFQVPVGQQNTEELWGKISPHASRVTADECLDLPERSYGRRESEMPEETRRAYVGMRDECLVEAESERWASATLPITQIMRLHQIACGHLPLEDGTVVELPTRKIEQLLELAEEDTGQLVVWCHFRHLTRRVAAALRAEYGDDSVVLYNGEVDEDGRKRAKDQFVRGVARFFLGSQAAAGRGLNELTVSRHAVFLSNPPDLELRLNAEARTRRQGSQRHGSVVYTDIITSGTVEEKIVRAMRERIDIASTVVGDKWREWLV